MSACELAVRLERQGRPYRPGEEVRGAVEVRARSACACRGLRLVREWRTHGRGNEAKGSPVSDVLFEGGWTAGQLASYPFRFAAPAGPLTYRGHLFNVDWYIRAEADLAGARDAKSEAELLLAPGPGDGSLDHGPLWKRPSNEPPPGKLDPSEFGYLGTVGCLLSFLGLAGGGMILLVGAGNRSGAMLAAGAAAVLVGAAILLGMWLQLRRVRRLWSLVEPVEMRLEPAEARPGERVVCLLAFAPRATLDLGPIAATLTGREEVVNGDGTGETRHRHEIDRQEALLLPARRVGPGERVSASAAFRLPTGAPATFTAKDNALRWSVRLRIPVRGWPDWIADAPLTVRP